MEHNSLTADSYIITCTDDARYSIDNIYSPAFSDKEFEQVAYGQTLYVSVDTTDMPSSDSTQPIYSVHTDDAVYLSAEDALDTIQKNADLGICMFPVMLGLAALYLGIFLYAMSDAEKHYKLLKLFIKPEYINLSHIRQQNRKKHR